MILVKCTSAEYTEKKLQHEVVIYKARAKSHPPPIQDFGHSRTKKARTAKIEFDSLAQEYWLVYNLIQTYYTFYPK